MPTSCPRRPVVQSTRQMFSWAMAERIRDARITKPKLAPNYPVKVEVCVRKPGPIADVAIRKAAPNSAPLDFFFSLISVYPLYRLRGLCPFSGQTAGQPHLGHCVYVPFAMSLIICIIYAILMTSRYFFEFLIPIRYNSQAVSL